MGEGRLSDNKGRLINFKNTIVILTSNIGCSNVKKGLGFGVVSESVEVLDSVKKHFRPEFVNRLDEVIVFNRLSKDDCYDVADILINALIKRVNSQGYKLFVENSAMDVIVENAYSYEYGARNVKRTISRYVEDLLSDGIISGDIKRGDVIIVYGESNRVTYKKG
jgi:ATP-dependent Clp protease ATP-binding subunit ClpC